ncbi:alternate-type signal peptide domain-containing protein [Mycetocola tolaasinivorans]|uniref:Alternate-type signal peptide domain-containing protein n=1 Tax=Mycetocola tolaasinivorans TaxID=76635 RepID=A0A3L7A9K0_9MICO|nr:alternate-type signal peptide domain-containing protein [Mycetocola tolaasinivorans]RLP77009.1 alternate-type signal peptide domain-containing protein [Mycetocola tolaasinivorans]
MKFSTRGIVAGALGLGLLAGGSTFALWNANTVVDAGQIEAGNLGVQAVDNVLWVDASPEHASPVTIDPADFRTVPGDKLERTQDLTVTLVGDNLKADLLVTSSALTFTGLPTPAPAAAITGTYTLIGKNGAAVSTPTALGQPTTLTVDRAAAKDSTATSATYTVRINLGFADVDGLVFANAKAALGDVTYKVTQVR